MLKMTKIELEKISDADIQLFIKKGMRGAISYASKRYSNANNKYCPDYDKNKPEIYINYIGMNNLYGGAMSEYLPYSGFEWVNAMSEYLPYSGFEWVNTTNETVNRILNKKDNSLHGYFLKVHLEYLENLHEEHSDYPMVPGKI